MISFEAPSNFLPVITREQLKSLERISLSRRTNASKSNNSPAIAGPAVCCQGVTMPPITLEKGVSAHKIKAIEHSEDRRIVNEKPPSRQNGENQILVENRTRTSGKGRLLSKQPRHRAARQSKTNPNSTKPTVLLDDNARIGKRGQRNKSTMDCAPDPLRRSSRLADRLEKVLR